MARVRAGSPRVTLRLRPACADGTGRPEVTQGSNHIRYVAPALTLRLTTDASLTALLQETPFFLEDSITLLLGPDETVHEAPGEIGRRFLEETVQHWQEWVRALAIPYEWQEAVIRAAITLKLNSYDDTGAIVAAMTTSIPEAAGSGRNWDYRYCWLRDGYFVVNALNRLGVTRTMERYIAYIVNIAANSGANPLQPVYGIDGRAALEEHQVPGLAGYRGMGPVRILIEAGIAIVLAALLYFAIRGVEIGWVALPIAVWAGLLILRPNMPDVKRFILFLIGTAMVITIVVELIVVRGDIGRMNTVFKFYLQAWALLSISAAAAFAWILPEIRKWLPGWRNFFQVGVTFVLAGAALTTISAASDKVADRMAPGVPFTLDSITYMQYAQYADFGETMDLSHDYRAIRWMQDNVQGSPIIVEANTTEYKWGTRFTIYTGLPGVVGWNWHQRQQRTLTPQLVEERIAEVTSFYTTEDPQAARDFLKKYNVKYIIVGQLEQLEYPGPGIQKFEQYNGQLWNSVYRDGDTIIYQVNP